MLMMDNTRKELSYLLDRYSELSEVDSEGYKIIDKIHDADWTMKAVLQLQGKSNTNYAYSDITCVLEWWNNLEEIQDGFTLDSLYKRATEKRSELIEDLNRLAEQYA